MPCPRAARLLAVSTTNPADVGLDAYGGTRVHWRLNDTETDTMPTERPPTQMRPLIDDDLQGRLRDFAHMSGVPIRRLVNEAVHRFLHKYDTDDAREAFGQPPRMVLR